MQDKFELFRKQVTGPLRFRLFMLLKLPSAFFAGLRIISFDSNQSSIAVKYKWFNQNPFRSMYFAVQSMAAEMSTGLLASGHIYQRNPAVSMLVVGIEASFVKKVTDVATFTCMDGESINQAIEKAIETGKGESVTCQSTGRNQAGEVVAEFFVTWSFKTKSNLVK